MADAKKKVLVMDDEDIVAEIAEQMLIFLGYATAVVDDGEKAISEYRQAREAGEPFDLVIMDLNIPGGMGGAEAVKHILAIDSQAKVLVSSGYANDPIVSAYGSYGFSGCITKPFDLQGLQDAIDSALE